MADNYFHNKQHDEKKKKKKIKVTGDEDNLSLDENARRGENGKDLPRRSSSREAEKKTKLKSIHVQNFKNAKTTQKDSHNQTLKSSNLVNNKLRILSPLMLKNKFKLMKQLPCSLAWLRYPL